MHCAQRFHSDAEIEAIGCGLLDRSLPKSAWTHAGHIAATLWIIATRPDIDPARDMPAIIRAYNLATGGENTDHAGYHETITQASLRACRRFLAARPADEPLHATCNALLESPLGDPDWVLGWWSRDVLFSVAARRGWVAPDLGRKGGQGSALDPLGPEAPAPHYEGGRRLITPPPA